MSWVSILLALIGAVGAAVCIGLSALTFVDNRERPWRLLLACLAIALLPLGVAYAFGLRGLTWEWAVLFYLAGLALCAMTIAWQYAKPSR